MKKFLRCRKKRFKLLSSQLIEFTKIIIKLILVDFLFNQRYQILINILTYF